jgi:hypothetical protein
VHVEQAIRTVDAESELVAVPARELSATRLPLWAVFSTMALQTRGIMQTASRGLAVTRKTSLFGKVRYEQGSRRANAHDTPWLIGTIACQCQSGRAFGVRLVHLG